MSGAVPSSLEGEVQSTPRVRSGDTPRPDAAIAARCPVALFDAQGSEVKRYLNDTRGLDDTTLAVYGVGYASRKFRDGERWVDEPCATFPWIQVPGDGPASTVRLKVRSVRTKRHMRVEPAGGDWGLFGLHTVPADAAELVITEGEYDAMAVYQATGRAAVSLPNGAASLPPAVLPLLERFKRIFLWCDGDEAGVNAARKFSAKLGRHRCVVVRAPDDCKDANDCLRKDPSLVKRALDDAGAPDHDGLVSFKELRGQVLHELRHPDLYVGAPLPSFPKLTGLVKGARPGELTLLTGPSGAGKTTLASQISIDLLESGAPTLWGSFEVKNSALAIKMLRQQARRRDGLPNEPRLLDALCDDFQRLPLHFMRFHAATEVDDVVDAMEFAAYVHDVEHVVLDNLQFMTQAGPRDASRFEAQDRAIARFRDFATRRGVHVVLVVHPRKEDPTQKLALTSIYGGAKAAQEADNVLILQAPAQPVAPGHASSQQSQAPIPKWVEVAKNRYAGTLGSVMMAFNDTTCRYYELSAGASASSASGAAVR
ncbi:unnamed protein product [Pelagomonas calceolata]|uniref:SF4 helicase domain-containing protein n=1 Tax=Pelagomonas calceolata TaxID=35677 RepID=A0A8J2SDM3_9STRA|nr:unnamed protein product [Pelagomonas calceolata]